MSSHCVWASATTGPIPHSSPCSCSDATHHSCDLKPSLGNSHRVLHVANYRGLTASNPDAFRPDLAQSLDNLSIQQGETGLRSEAL